MISVNSLGANSIRIMVTGKTQLPKGLVRQSECAERTPCDRTLVLSWTAPANTTATQPTSTPDSTTEGEPAAEEPAATTEPNSETDEAEVEPVTEGSR